MLRLCSKGWFYSPSSDPRGPWCTFVGVGSWAGEGARKTNIWAGVPAWWRPLNWGQEGDSSRDSSHLPRPGTDTGNYALQRFWAELGWASLGSYRNAEQNLIQPRCWKWGESANWGRTLTPPPPPATTLNFLSLKHIRADLPCRAFAYAILSAQNAFP